MRPSPPGHRQDLRRGTAVRRPMVRSPGATCTSDESVEFPPECPPRLLLRVTHELGSRCRSPGRSGMPRSTRWSASPSTRVAATSPRRSARASASGRSRRALSRSIDGLRASAGPSLPRSCCRARRCCVPQHRAACAACRRDSSSRCTASASPRKRRGWLRQTFRAAGLRRGAFPPGTSAGRGRCDPALVLNWARGALTG